MKNQLKFTMLIVAVLISVIISSSCTTVETMSASPESVINKSLSNEEMKVNADDYVKYIQALIITLKKEFKETNTTNRIIDYTSIASAGLGAILLPIVQSEDGKTWIGVSASAVAFFAQSYKNIFNTDLEQMRKDIDDCVQIVTLWQNTSKDSPNFPSVYNQLTNFYAKILSKY